MDKKNKIILAVIAVVIVAAVVIAAVISSNSGNNNSTAENNTQQTATEAPKVKPTFIYFVSKNDETYDAEMALVEKLKNTYGSEVNFDIRDVDQDATIAENFAFVPGNTPPLIMLNTSNDISSMQMKCVDETILVNEIEKAME